MARKAVCVVLLGAALVCARPASGQQNSANARAIAAGDRVYATQQADLKIESETVATASKDDALSVREVSGKWLWVETGNGDRGWIDRQYVTVTAPAATPKPSVLTEPSPAPAVTPDPAADSSEVESRLLLTVGALAGQNVYVTYAYIGTVADGYANKVYSADQVQELMKEVVGLCSVAHDFMQNLAESKITADDRATIEHMAGILDLLRQEADALSSFAKSESKKDLDAYDAARSAAWPQIQSALGINK
jgi:hypothetical protein